MIKLGANKIPQIELELPDGDKHAILLVGPVAAEFFARALKAFGAINRSELADVLMAKGGSDPDELLLIEAVDNLLPDELGLRGQLSVAEYTDIFRETWLLVLGEYSKETKPEETEKKNVNTSPQ